MKNSQISRSKLFLVIIFLYGGMSFAQKKDVIEPLELIADSYEAETYYSYNKQSGKKRVGGLTANYDGPLLYSNTGYNLRFGVGSDVGSEAVMTLTKEGYVGIGAPDPKAPLHVRGITFFSNGNGNSHIPYSDNNIYLSAPELFIRDADDQAKFTFDNTNGRLGIGVGFSKISSANLTKYNLFVANGVLTEKYGLAPVNSWADYVFSDTYQLKGLSKVESYIKMNKRLPNIPSADEIAKEGYSLHDMNVKFLEKIEELTLYAIDQEKQLKKLESQLEEYKLLAEQVQQLKDKMLKNR